MSLIIYLMGKNILGAVLISIAILIAIYPTNVSKVDTFQEWKGKYGVFWTPSEEPYRRLIFEKNIILINHHNSDTSQTYKQGINQFTVYTHQEFTTRFLIQIPTPTSLPTHQKYSVAADIDWVAQGKVSPVKNQGQCGSCWAFSATGVLESWSLQKGKSVNLSEQQLVDCARQYGNQGCSGGLAGAGLKYVQTKGIASQDQYGYVGKDQACKMEGGSFKIGATHSFSGCSGLSTQINDSTISVRVDATNWNSYKSGVFNNCLANLNHAVLLVGVLDGNWKIKNSWGTGWGESGYIRLAAGNVCGLCTYFGIAPI